MGRKRSLPRTCGCASRGRHRCSCPEAAPSQRASYEALSPTKRARLEYTRDHVVKHRANVKMMICPRLIPSSTARRNFAGSAKFRGFSDSSRKVRVCVACGVWQYAGIGKAVFLMR